MNPFEVTVTGELTVHEFCWIHGVSLVEFRDLNRDRTWTLQSGEVCDLGSLGPGDVIPQRAVVRLPPLLQVRGRPYGERFLVADFRRRLNALKLPFSDAVQLLPAPVRAHKTCVEKLADVIRDESLRQARVMRATPAAANKLLADVVDPRPVAEAMQRMRDDGAGTHLRALKPENAALFVELASSAPVRSHSALTPAMQHTVTDSCGGMVVASEAVQLQIDVMEVRSAHKLRETWIVVDQQLLTTFLDAVSCRKRQLPLELTKNAFMFIGGAFYVDMRHKNEESFCDTSEVLRQWAPTADGRPVYGDCPVRSMETTTFADLNIRLNEMCVLRHFGNCDHYFTITSVSRLASGTVSAQGLAPLSDFPKRTYLAPDRITLCDMCARLPATTVVYGDRLTPRNPTLFCGMCYHAFHCDENGAEINDQFVKFELPAGHFGSLVDPAPDQQ